MRIGIVRGSFLNKSEMQNYEPLKEMYQITAYHSNCAGHDIDLIDLPKKQLTSLEGLLGVGLSKYLKYPFGFFSKSQYMIGLEKELKSCDIAHVVETHNAFSYQAVVSKKKYGTRLVATQWENIPFYGENHPLKKSIKESVRKNADHFIAVTERAKDALLIEGVSEERITTVPMGVDLGRFKPDEKNKDYFTGYGIQPDDFKLLFAGRLVWEKGIWDLIYATRLISIYRKDLNFKLILMGSGPNTNEIIGLIRKLNLTDYIKLIGYFSYDRVHEVYQNADAFVLPSIPTKAWQEQYGMVLIESMACGLPVITTISGSIPEVVGDAAILIQPNDPHSLFQSIVTLADDTNMQSALRRKGISRARLFDARKVAKDIGSIYNSLIR